jgi:hypothetical protein
MLSIELKNLESEAYVRGFLDGYAEGALAAWSLYEGTIKDKKEYPHLHGDPDGQTERDLGYRAGFDFSADLSLMILKGALRRDEPAKTRSGRVISFPGQT